MCAILAALLHCPVPLPQMLSALKTMQHRGPDDSCYWQNERAFLGQNRLAIVDVPHGRQPIWNEDRSIAVVVNGEFYKTETLRQSLEAQGHVFHCQSDSEVLLHLYEQHGREAIHSLRGEFAFVLYDRIKDLMWAARDRFGIRPLYWLENEFGIFLASEGKALPGPKRLDLGSLHFASYFQYLPQGASWYEGIHLLEPGFELVIQDGKAHQSRYWNLPKERATKSPELTELRERLKEAVSVRIPQEVKACTHLSGGLDSSILTALAAPYGVEDAFVVSFPEVSQYDEAGLAEKTAEFVGVRLHKVEVTLKNILETFPATVRVSEGTFINGHGPAKYLLSQGISSLGFKVALTGEGADEIFYGYTHLRADVLDRRVEDPEVRGIHTPAAPVTIPAMEEAFGFTPSWVGAKSELGTLLQSFIQLGHLPLPYPQFLKPLRDFQDRSRGEISAGSWIKYGLSGYILRSLDDGLGLANAVESRIPFLDHSLVEWVKENIPQKDHFLEGLEKSVLRRAFKDLLHPEVYAGSKHPFMAPPLQIALCRPERSLLVDPILDSKHSFLLKDEIATWLNRLTDRVRAGKIVPADEPILVTLLSLAYL